MHVPEGVLSSPVLLSTGVLAAAGVAAGLRAVNDENIVKTAVLSSAFFIASLIHVPFGPVSVHLVMNGLAGLLLGWTVFPAMAVALLLHAVLFGYGGFTSLGANLIIMAVPGLLCYYAYRGAAQSAEGPALFATGFAAGATAIVVGGLCLSGALFASGSEFTTVAAAALGAHIPVAVIEGFVTAFTLGFLRKVRPETLHYQKPRLAAAE